MKPLDQNALDYFTAQGKKGWEAKVKKNGLKKAISLQRTAVLTRVKNSKKLSTRKGVVADAEAGV